MISSFFSSSSSLKYFKLMAYTFQDLRDITFFYPSRPKWSLFFPASDQVINSVYLYLDYTEERSEILPNFVLRAIYIILFFYIGNHRFLIIFFYFVYISLNRWIYSLLFLHWPKLIYDLKEPLFKMFQKLF
jgi:hypothetical protein